MKKNIQETLSFILAFCLAVGCLTFSASAATTYNSTKALQYAAAHWNDGQELCAGFVSNCLKAGGLSSWNRECTALFNQLNREVVQGAKIAQVNTLKTSGNYIKVSENKDKISAGDVLFWRCPDCPYDRVGGDYQHAAIVSDVKGTYVKVYQHNGAVNNQPAWVGTCYECGRAYKQMVVVHFKSAPSVSLSFSTSSIALNTGKAQTISVNFKGNGIQSISFGFGDDSKGSNSLGKASWGSVDWSKGTATINIQPRSGKAGETTFTVWLKDANGKVLTQKTIPFKVTQSKQIIELSSPVKISIPKGDLACLYKNPDDKVECCLVDARNSSLTVQSKRYCILPDGSRRYEVPVSGGQMLWLAIDSKMTIK